MDITASKKDLQSLIARCCGVADKRATMPVLANVLLTAEGSTLRAAATDLFLAVNGKMGAEVARPGRVALDAHDLLPRVRALPDGPVRIRVNANDKATVSAVSSSRRFTMPALSGTDYPTLPQTKDGATELELPTDALRTLFGRTKHAMCTDDTRPQLAGLLLRFGDGKVTAATTDGHRLAIGSVAVPLEHTGDLFVPQKAVRELDKLLEVASAKAITLTQSEVHLFAEVDEWELSVKLVDAPFPPYEQVIPSESGHVATVSRARLLDALKAVAVSSAREGGVKLSLVPGVDSKVTITGSGPDAGDGYDEVPAEYDGPPREVGMNARYIIEALSAVACDEVTLGVTGELEPVMVRPVDEAIDYRAIVMPMRIGSAK